MVPKGYSSGIARDRDAHKPQQPPQNPPHFPQPFPHDLQPRRLHFLPLTAQSVHESPHSPQPSHWLQDLFFRPKPLNFHLLPPSLHDAQEPSVQTPVEQLPSEQPLFPHRDVAHPERPIAVQASKPKVIPCR